MTFQYREENQASMLAQLLKYKDLNPIILALPGEAFANTGKIADGLKASTDVLSVHKIVVPYRQDMVVGSIIENEEPIWYEHVLAGVGLQPDDLYANVKLERAKARAEIESLRAGRCLSTLVNRNVIYVDDGFLCESVLFSLLKYLKKKGPAKLIVAAPFSRVSNKMQLDSRIDELVVFDDRARVLPASNCYQTYSPIVRQQIRGRFDLDNTIDNLD